jgi:AcrR family transcriptional regulator
VSRGAVLAAAKKRFAEDGYEKTTLRAIADDAHVDPSMVLYLFGSKADLFRAALRLIIDPDVPETANSMAAMLHSATSGGDEQARLRAMLAATNLVGTALLRYVMKVPPLATLPAEDVVRMIAPTVTRYLTADADELGLPEP